MNKLTKILMTGALMTSLVGCSNGSKDITGTYSIHVEGYDWGCGVNQVVMKLSSPISGVDGSDFVVTEHKQTTDWAAEGFPVVEKDFERKVLDAYTCDKDGNKVDKESEYVLIDLYCSPNDGSPLLYSMATSSNSWSDPYYLDIQLAKEASIQASGNEVESFKIEKEFSAKSTEADVFELDTFTSSEDIELKYGLYKASEAETLIVWLHGGGEGGTQGTDPFVSALGSEVTSLISEDFQSMINGANVLVPQCPTNWIDTDGQGNIMNADGSYNYQEDSYYTSSLKELIDQAKEETNSKYVVVGGCSAGGYMTMKLVLENPTYFTAAIPVCEAYPDEFISDEELSTIKDLPMYFIYSKDDGSALPESFSIPTSTRLQAINGNVHVSSSDHVVDLSGTLNDLNEGNPYQYNGHWSWIYFFNNESQCVAMIQMYGRGLLIN